MIISDNLISPLLAALTGFFSIPVIVLALVSAPWRALLQKPERQHALFAACLALVLVMKLQIAWVDGVSVHFLAMTTLVVIFGWSFSLIIGAIAQLLLALWQGNLPGAIAVDYWLATVVPASAAFAVFHLIDRHRSRNLFIFLLGGGFFGAMFALLCAWSALLLFLLISGSWQVLANLWDSSLMVVLFCYAEGFTNGLLVTALTVFFPGLVRMFDERKYLDR